MFSDLGRTCALLGVDWLKLSELFLAEEDSPWWANEKALPFRFGVHIIIAIKKQDEKTANLLCQEPTGNTQFVCST